MVLKKKDDYGNSINDKPYQKRIKKYYKDLLKTITTKSNKTNLNIYTKNVKDIEKLNNKLIDISKFIKYLDITNVEISNKLNSINDGLEENIRIEKSILTFLIKSYLKWSYLDVL